MCPIKDHLQLKIYLLTVILTTVVIVEGDRRGVPSNVNYDQLRVSSNNPNSQAPYDRISPVYAQSQDISSADVNGLKPVRLPQRPYQQQQQQQYQQQQQQQQPSPNNYNAYYRNPNINNGQLQQQQQQQATKNNNQKIISPRLSKSAAAAAALKFQQEQQRREQSNKCRWWSQKSFQAVNLESDDLIVNDEYNSPCYIISLSAYLELRNPPKAPLYFPLDKYSIRPSANKVILNSRTSDGATSQDLPMNCSIPLHADGRECGFLKLRLNSNGYLLALESIEFYLTSMPDGDYSSNGISGAGSRDNHDLFYSTQSSRNSPLLIIPMASRYICEHRIVLTSNNSIQLVIDKFLIQKLYNINQQVIDIPVDQYPPNYKSSQFSSEIDLALNQQEEQQHHHHRLDDEIVLDNATSNIDDNNNNYQTGDMIIQQSPDRLNRDVKNLAITSRLTRRNLGAAGISSSLIQNHPEHESFVKRCPEPRSPTEPLDTMMDKEILNNSTILANLLYMDNQIALASSSATTIAVANIHFVILCLLSSIVIVSL